MFKDKNQHLLRTRRRPACICSEEKCQFPLAGNTGCAHYTAHWYYISPDTYFSKFLKMLSVFETYLSSIYYMLGVKRWPRPSACLPWASKSSWQQTQLPRLGHPLVETFAQATYQTPLCLSDTIHSATSHTSTFIRQIHSTFPTILGPRRPHSIKSNLSQSLDHQNLALTGRPWTPTSGSSFYVIKPLFSKMYWVLELHLNCDSFICCQD